MIVNIGELVTKRRDTRRRKKINTINNQPSSTSIEEAKAKVQAIIDSGAVIRKKKDREQN